MKILSNYRNPLPILRYIQVCRFSNYLPIFKMYIKGTYFKNFNWFSAPWSPSDFKDGKIHVIKVILNQSIIIAESKFSLSPSSDLGTTGLIAKIVLYFNWSLATQAVFGICAASIIIPLCYLRLRPRHGNWRLVCNSILWFFFYFWLCDSTNYYRGIQVKLDETKQLFQIENNQWGSKTGFVHFL